MAKTQLPAYILKDCTLVAASGNRIGQVSEITIPVLEKTMEEIRNAGMIKPREVSMGFEKLEFNFKMPGLDPQILKLFGLKAGTENLFLITGALVDEDGVEHSAVMTIRGFLKQADPGNWKPGDMAENDYSVSVNYYKLEVDGDELIEMDDFDVKIGGISQHSGMRNSLLL